MDAEDVVQDAGEGGRPFDFGRGREAPVVVRQVNLLEEAVGLGHVGDAGEPEFLGQALLQGAEHPLRAPTGLGRVGSDVLDAELAERSPDLGRVVLVDFAASLGRVEVVAAAVRVNRTARARRSPREAQVDMVLSSATKKAE